MKDRRKEKEDIVAVTWGLKRVVYGACISGQLQGRPAASFNYISL